MKLQMCLNCFKYNQNNVMKIYIWYLVPFREYMQTDGKDKHIPKREKIVGIPGIIAQFARNSVFIQGYLVVWRSSFFSISIFDYR